MRLHTLPSLSWSLRTNLGIFFVKAERKEERRKEEEINKGELVYTSSPLYYNCTFKVKSI